MAKSPEKKKYVVTYYRSLDEKRSKKTGAKIPLRTKLVDANNPEDALNQVKTDARIIVSAKLRGRGGVKKVPGFLIADVVIEDQNDVALEKLDAIDTAFEALASTTEAPDQQNQPEAARETPDTINEESSEGVSNEPELTEEERAAKEQQEAEKAENDRLDAIKKVESLIEVHTYYRGTLVREIERLELASERSVEAFQEIEGEVHELENRLSLRPIAIEALKKNFGELPAGVNEADETLIEDIADLRVEVGLKAYFGELRNREIERLEAAYDRETETLRALRFLLSELTGEPFNEEEDDEEETESAEIETKGSLSLANAVTVIAITLIASVLSVVHLPIVVRASATVLLIVLTASLVSSKNVVDDCDHDDYEG